MLRYITISQENIDVACYYHLSLWVLFSTEMTREAVNVVILMNYNYTI